ncbi:MAG: amidase family protein [Solirubrobacterales bacterium]
MPADAGPLRSPLLALDAVALVEGYRSRRISPVEVVDAVLDQIEAYNPTLNAFVTVSGEAAREQARSAERAYREGGDHHPPLLGVPYSVKDTILTAGVRTTMGSRTLAEWVPAVDAPVVERMRAAGAIFLGKTNTPEFGWKLETTNPLVGTTRNPWDPALTPGGSSGGAAVAVAMGMGPIAIASDTAGSIRVPGSFCGVVGYKPSFGRIPFAPGGPIESLGHVGVLARSVRDVALVLETTAGPDERDRFSLTGPVPPFAAELEPAAGPLSAAWSEDLGFAPVESATVEISERAARDLAPSAWELSELELSVEDPIECIEVLLAAAMAAAAGDSLDEVRSVIDPERLEVVERGLQTSGAAVAGVNTRRAALVEALRVAFGDRDLIVTPAVPLPPFAAGQTAPDAVGGRATPWLRWGGLSYPFNLTGQPAISLPCGLDARGLPVGMQLVGRQHADSTVLCAAAAVERAMPWADRWPASIAEPGT